MKTASAVSLALFLGSMTLLAQSSGRNTGRKNTKTIVVRVAPASTNCPVNMQAQRQSSVRKLPVGKSAVPGPAQTLAFTLSNPTFQEILEVHITVHGLDAKGRVSPAQEVSEESSDITKSFDLKLKIDPKSQASTELTLPGFTSVRSIDLTSVRYADGSHWRSSADHTCHAVPDGMMLISSR